MIYRCLCTFKTNIFQFQKMSKPSKLSRGRSRRKNVSSTQPKTQLQTNLDDSADEFSSLTSQNLRPDSQIWGVNLVEDTCSGKKTKNGGLDEQRRLSAVFEDTCKVDTKVV